MVPQKSNHRLYTSNALDLQITFADKDKNITYCCNFITFEYFAQTCLLKNKLELKGFNMQILGLKRLVTMT